MKLLVTGGNGFIGSHIVEAALSAGYEVAVLDRDSSTRRPGGVGFLHCDLRNRDDVMDALRVFRPDYVNHHAALVDAPGSVRDPEGHFRNNVLGSVNLLDACTAVGTVKRIVFASSGSAIYGEAGEAPSTEDDNPRPETPYGVAKLAVEKHLECMYPHGAPPVTSLRYPNVYGPRQLTGVVGRFMFAGIAGAPMQVFGSCTRQYVYVEDIARANLLALRHPEVGCRVYNVGSVNPLRTVLLASHIRAITGGESEILQEKERVGDIEETEFSGRRFEIETGFKCQVDLVEGLRKTLAWWKER